MSRRCSTAMNNPAAWRGDSRIRPGCAPRLRWAPWRHCGGCSVPAACELHQQQLSPPKQQRHPSLLRRHLTLESLTACSSRVGNVLPFPAATSPTAGAPCNQPASQPEPTERQETVAGAADREWHGPRVRYGMPVTSCHELQEAVLRHWESTAGDKVPGSDSEEALTVPGLAEVGVVSLCGREWDDWKLQCQDSHMVLPLHTPGADSSSAPAALALGVFDGHGFLGAAASRCVRRGLSSSLPLEHRQHCLAIAQQAAAPAAAADCGNGPGSTAPLALSPEQAQLLLEAGFEAAAEDMACRGDFSESGSTAAVVLLERGRLTAAWCGDSGAALGLQLDQLPEGDSSSSGNGWGSARDIDSRGALLVHPLTADHRPNNPLERQRIEAAGGQVLQLGHDAQGNPAGPFRLCGSNPYHTPRPMVSRCFGDANATAWGLTHTPDIVSLDLPPRPSSSSSSSSSSTGSCASTPARRHVLVLATDGFWDTSTPDDAVLLALSCATAQEAARALADAALRRWAVETAGVRCDDITVCVAFLDI